MQNFKIKSQNLDSFKNFKIFFEKISKKIFFQKNFSFVLKNTLKSPQHKKVKKKFFFGQIGLEFFSYHDQLVDRAVSRVAPIERKSIFAYLRFHQKKIFKMDHFQILSERPKVFIFEHFGTNGLTFEEQLEQKCSIPVIKGLKNIETFFLEHAPITVS